MERGGPEVLLRGNQEGIDKVVSEKGSYAFFMESVTIEYLTNRNCDLRQVGTPLDSKSYGIAMPQGIYKATDKATYSEVSNKSTACNKSTAIPNLVCGTIGVT